MQEKNGSRKVADYIKRIFSSVFGRKNVCGLDSCNMPETVNDYSRLYKKYKNDEEQEKRLRKKVIGNGAGKRADANYYFRLYLRPDDIKKCIKMYPILECEFNSDGRRKSLKEHLDYVSENRFKVNLVGMEQITRCLFGECPVFDPYAIPYIDRFLQDSVKEDEYKYVSGISEDIIPTMLEEIQWMFDVGRKMNDETMYTNYFSVCNLIETIKKNKSKRNFLGFITTNKNGKTTMDSLNELKQLFDDKKPELKVKFKNEKRIKNDDEYEY